MGLQGKAPLVRVDREVCAGVAGLERVHELMAEYWRAVDTAGCCGADATWRALFDSAVAEIAGNIVRHAYPDPTDDDRFQVTLQCFDDRMEAILVDRGVPYDLSPPTRSADMRDVLDDFELDHGWGLPIAYAATDSLEYERLPDGSNRWRLDKRFP